MRKKPESGFFSSREPRVILQSDTPRFFAISRWGVPSRNAFTKAQRDAMSAISAGVNKQERNAPSNSLSPVDASALHSSFISSSTLGSSIVIGLIILKKEEAVEPCAGLIWQWPLLS
jgi:hypothetical protein